MHDFSKVWKFTFKQNKLSDTDTYYKSFNLD